MVFLLIFFYLLGDFHLIFMAEFRELDFSWTQIGVQRAFFCYWVVTEYFSLIRSPALFSRLILNFGKVESVFG